MNYFIDTCADQVTYMGGLLEPTGFLERLRTFVQVEAGRKTHQFRAVGPLDFYRIVKSVLLIRLVFPDDDLLTGKPSPAQVLEVKAHLWDLARRYLAPNAEAKALQRAPRRQKRASVARA